MRSTIKSALCRIAPNWTLAALSIRSRRLIERQTAEMGLLQLGNEIAASAGFGVQSGPFLGAKLNPAFLPVHISPKLLGTYENELSEPIERLIKRSPQQVINIGCAEGYYAIGLAMRLPHAKVEAFDADPKARRATRQNAGLNGLEGRVRVHGILHPAPFESLLRSARTLVVIDCEGGEAELLDPTRAPSLASADVLAELHPAIVPSVEDMMLNRFSSSHRIELYRPQAPSVKASRAPDWLPQESRAAATDERRGVNTWLAMFATGV